MKRSRFFSSLVAIVLCVACLLGLAPAAAAANMGSYHLLSQPTTVIHTPDLDYNLGYTYNVRSGDIDGVYVQTTPPATPPPGPLTNTSTQTLISFRGQISQVIAQKIGSLTNLFGFKGFNVDLNIFGGFQFNTNGLTGGGSATHAFHVSPELDVVLGAYIQGTSQKKLDGGLVIGASLHFKSS